MSVERKAVSVEQEAVDRVVGAMEEVLAAREKADTAGEIEALKKLKASLFAIGKRKRDLFDELDLKLGRALRDFLTLFDWEKEPALAAIKLLIDIHLERAPVEELFYKAAVLKDEECYKLLVEAYGYDINDGRLKTALHLATNYGDTQAIEQLIQWRADINATNSDDQTPLFAAISNHAVATYLLEKKAAVNAKTSFGSTPLHVAASCDDVSVETLRYLIAQGGDVNARTIANDSVLQCAVEGGNIEKTQALLEGEARIEERDEFRINHNVKNKEKIGELLMGIGVDEDMITPALVSAGPLIPGKSSSSSSYSLSKNSAAKFAHSSSVTTRDGAPEKKPADADALSVEPVQSGGSGRSFASSSSQDGD